jgi:hypothetical protein
LNAFEQFQSTLDQFQGQEYSRFLGENQQDWLDLQREVILLRKAVLGWKEY